MKIRIHPYKPEYYDGINALFVAQGWDTAPPVSAIPQNGFVAIDDESGSYIAACFYFITSNSRFGMVDYAVANPLAPATRRLHSLSTCVLLCIEEVRKHAEYVCAWTANPAMVKIFQRCGFSIGEEGVTSLFIAPEGDTKLGFLKE